MTAFSIFVMLKFFGHFVLPFQTFRFADYIFMIYKIIQNKNNKNHLNLDGFFICIVICKCVLVNKL